MAGHRDDGTFAEDKAHHPNRKVGTQSCAVCGIKKHDYHNSNHPMGGEPCENEWGGACGHTWR